MMDKDNASPTILNPNQLPTRRQKEPQEVNNGPGKEIAELLKPRVGYVIEDDELSDPESQNGEVEPIDEQEIYDLISTISDPEHPLSLGSLAVVNLADIHISPSPALPTSKTLTRVLVEITPTITHCSLATVIGLGVRVRLEQALPPNFRVDVKIKEGSHSQDDQVSKQLADRERVAAALENATLMGVVRKMLETCK